MKNKFSGMQDIHSSQPVLLDEELLEVVGAADCKQSCEFTCEVTCDTTCSNSCSHTKFTITTKDQTGSPL